MCFSQSCKLVYCKNYTSLFFYIWQIDSIMSTRTSGENEASRRLKSEFLVQFDGVTSNSDDLVIVIGKTHISLVMPYSNVDIQYLEL